MHADPVGTYEYLITRRSMSKIAFPGKWTVPGGGLSSNDFAFERQTEDTWYDVLANSVRREVLEEVGLAIDDIVHVTDGVLVRPDGVQVLLLSFAAGYVNGVVKLDDDSIDCAWATAEGARQYDLIDGIVSEIAMVEKMLTRFDYPRHLRFDYIG